MPETPTATSLSIAMVVRDAESFLAETLRSMAGLGAEIVVLDTGSSDQTARIAERHGARVVRDRWDRDFAGARNRCAALVRGDWILWLDAGETITDKSTQQIREFVASGPDRSKGYAILVQVPQFGSDIAAEQVARVRLVPNRAGLLFAGRVRERLIRKSDGQPAEVEGMPGIIQRGTREHDEQVKLTRAHRNLELATLAMQEHGPQARLLSCLGEALQTTGDDGRALQCYRHALQISPRGSSEMLEAYYGMMTSLERQPKGRESQLSVCLEALEVFPLDAQLLCAMGGYLQSQGRLDLATRAYQTAFEHGTVDPCLWHLDRILEISAICYSVALQLGGQGERAQQVLEEAVASTPQAQALQRQLLELYVQHGLREPALKLVASLPAETPHREALRSAIRGACLAQQKNWIAARAYLHAAYEAGCREPLCLRWLLTTLMALQEITAAQVIVDQWKQAIPNSAEAANYASALATSSVAEPAAARAELERHLRIDGPSHPDAESNHFAGRPASAQAPRQNR